MLAFQEACSLTQNSVCPQILSPPRPVRDRQRHPGAQHEPWLPTAFARGGLRFKPSAVSLAVRLFESLSKQYIETNPKKNRSR